jgi:hypothetical protein
MRNHNGAASDPTGRDGAPDQPAPAELDIGAGPDDDRSFWGRPPLDGVAESVAVPMTRHSGASERFRRALASGNPRLVRAAASVFAGDHRRSVAPPD